MFHHFFPFFADCENSYHLIVLARSLMMMMMMMMVVVIIMMIIVMHKNIATRYSIFKKVKDLLVRSILVVRRSKMRVACHSPKAKKWQNNPFIIPGIMQTFRNNLVITHNER